MLLLHLVVNWQVLPLICILLFCKFTLLPFYHILSRLVKTDQVVTKLKGTLFVGAQIYQRFWGNPWKKNVPLNVWVLAKLVV